jgi:uncharacterized membrane-anchored protein
MAKRRKPNGNAAAVAAIEQAAQTGATELNLSDNQLTTLPSGHGVWFHSRKT